MRYFVYVWREEFDGWETYGDYTDEFTAKLSVARLLKWGEKAYMKQDFEF